MLPPKFQIAQSKKKSKHLINVFPMIRSPDVYARDMKRYIMDYMNVREENANIIVYELSKMHKGHIPGANHNYTIYVQGKPRGIPSKISLDSYNHLMEIFGPETTLDDIANIVTQPWWLGAVNSEEAKEMICRSPYKVFVRYHDLYNNAITLCICKNGKLKERDFIINSNGTITVDGNTYDNIPNLVKYWEEKYTYPRPIKDYESEPWWSNIIDSYEFVEFLCKNHNKNKLFVKKSGTDSMAIVFGYCKDSEEPSLMRYTVDSAGYIYTPKENIKRWSNLSKLVKSYATATNVDVPISAEHVRVFISLTIRLKRAWWSNIVDSREFKNFLCEEHNKNKVFVRRNESDPNGIIVGFCKNGLEVRQIRYTVTEKYKFIDDGGNVYDKIFPLLDNLVKKNKLDSLGYKHSYLGGLSGLPIPY